MKKKIILISSFLLILLLCSCKEELINNADTGEIILSENRYSYTDGEYFCSYDHYGKDGFCAAAAMSVRGGIIKNIRFDYFTIDGKSLSGDFSPENEKLSQELRSARKSFYTKTLARQDIASVRMSASGNFGRDYCTLMDEMLRSAACGGEKILSCEASDTFSASVNLTENILATLSVTFVSADPARIVFDITDLSGSSLAADGATCNQLFGISADETLLAISSLEDISTGLKKENTGELPEAVTDVYNSLADNILLRIIPFDADPESLFLF